MELKTYIEIKNLAAYLRGLAHSAEEFEMLVDTADKLDNIAENDLPYMLK